MSTLFGPPALTQVASVLLGAAVVLPAAVCALLVRLLAASLMSGPYSNMSYWCQLFESKQAPRQELHLGL